MGLLGCIIRVAHLFNPFASLNTWLRSFLYYLCAKSKSIDNTRDNPLNLENIL
jgi:hypothetical protein